MLILPYFHGVHTFADGTASAEKWYEPSSLLVVVVWKYICVLSFLSAFSKKYKKAKPSFRSYRHLLFTFYVLLTVESYLDFFFLHFFLLLIFFRLKVKFYSKFICFCASRPSSSLSSYQAPFLFDALEYFHRRRSRVCVWFYNSINSPDFAYGRLCDIIHIAEITTFCFVFFFLLQSVD